jgi:hypothetical protein
MPYSRSSRTRRPRQPFKEFSGYLVPRLHKLHKPRMLSVEAVSHQQSPCLHDLRLMVARTEILRDPTLVTPLKEKESACPLDPQGMLRRIQHLPHTRLHQQSQI